jgi:hypothetical protein
MARFDAFDTLEAFQSEFLFMCIYLFELNTRKAHAAHVIRRF